MTLFLNILPCLYPSYTGRGRIFKRVEITLLFLGTDKPMPLTAISPFSFNKFSFPLKRMFTG